MEIYVGPEKTQFSEHRVEKNRCRAEVSKVGEQKKTKSETKKWKLRFFVREIRPNENAKRKNVRDTNLVLRSHGKEKWNLKNTIKVLIKKKGRKSRVELGNIVEVGGTHYFVEREIHRIS